MVLVALVLLAATWILLVNGAIIPGMIVALIGLVLSMAKLKNS